MAAAGEPGWEVMFSRGFRAEGAQGGGHMATALVIM